MATPVLGQDDGSANYGVLGTSVNAVGVKGQGGKGPIIRRFPPPPAPKAGVYGEHTQDGYGVLGSSVSGPGVFGQSSSTDGVHGKSTSASGVSGESSRGHGVYGVSSNDGSAAVLGESKSGSGVGVEGTGVWAGVHGVSLETGVYGESATKDSQAVLGQTTNGVGVQGQAFVDFNRNEQGPFPNIGVSGYSDYGPGVVASSSNGDGLISYAGGPLGRAATLHGDVQIDGNLTKGGGGFKIDHPLDAANKYLVHSFVESPERKNVYDGVVTLNARGEAEVRLPKWFGALNEQFRYQLTALGAPAPDLHVAKQIVGSSFRIAGGKARMQVCWQVTGVRIDRWAKANPLVVEQPKTGQERGRFLHPKAHGKSEKFALEGATPPKPKRRGRPKKG